MRLLRYFEYLVLIATLSVPTTAKAELINWRVNCSPWDQVPAADTFGNPENALLFCINDDGQTWLALQVYCDPQTAKMIVRYRPGFNFQPPIIQQNNDKILNTKDDVSTADREAAALVESIPYNDSGIQTKLPSQSGPTEMVFINFNSFSYTNVANYNDATRVWSFIEKEPLSPVFGHLVSDNFVDIKLMAYKQSERFPLRGSSKALRPLIEACRISKHRPIKK